LEALVRRSVTDEKCAFYVLFAPAQTSLSKSVSVAGQRWTIEECIEIAKDELGLDGYEVRTWHGWYRHITLVMLAQACLNVICLQATTEEKKRVQSVAGHARTRPFNTFGSTPLVVACYRNG
jgi:SRSO17 transposase